MKARRIWSQVVSTKSGNVLGTPHSGFGWCHLTCGVPGTLSAHTLESRRIHPDRHGAIVDKRNFHVRLEDTLCNCDPFRRK